MTNVFRYAQKWVALCVVLTLLLGCKTKKILAEGSLNANLSAKTVIRSHYQNSLDFKTLRGKMKIDYSDGESSQGLSLSVRIKKDSAIWMSAPLGIVKVYITPQRVTFYNKLENEYFDGDFTYLSNLLGTDLDYGKIQNLLLGQAMFDMRLNKYDVSISGDNYVLKPKNTIELFKILFEIEPKNFKMASQILSQPLKRRLLDINYKNYQKINKWILPNQIFIVATEGTKRNTIEIEYRNMEFDEPVSFPYKIPNGFKEIVLTKDDI
ncbi:MAG: DUF4292 domain-containing protein [Maribacter sp.]|nr:DUF4292 domain-containing protein [Maribacter sp.]